MAKNIGCYFLSAVLILVSIACGGSRIEDFDYSTKVDRQKLLEMRGEAVAILPIQYNDDAIIGHERIDPSLISVFQDEQMRAISTEFDDLFKLVEISVEDSVSLESEYSPNNSEIIRVISEKFDVDGCLIVINSYDYDYYNIRGGIADNYKIASETYLIDKLGNITWYFYGKVNSAPIPSELFSPDALSETLKWVVFVPTSEQVHIRPITRIIYHYTAYIRWLMETDFLGSSSKNYYIDYPEEYRNKYIHIFPAYSSPTPRIATPVK